jgi:hypothetical protein
MADQILGTKQTFAPFPGNNQERLAVLLCASSLFFGYFTTTLALGGCSALEGT